MNFIGFLTIACLLSCSYGISVNKLREEGDRTTTFAPQADDIVSDDSQPGPSTILPSDQSDGVEVVTENDGDSTSPQPVFSYPVTPDPNPDTDFTTVNPVPSDFNISNLDDVQLNYVDNSTYNVRVVMGVSARAVCTCGRSTGRIVGGNLDKINRLPWTAALVRGSVYSSGRPYCGATLINSRYVLTASHCVDGMTPRGISVRLMQEDVYNSPHVQAFGVDKIIMHPNYNRQNIDHDIALVQLSQPVKLGPDEVVTPACLPASNDFNIEGATATVAGWGATAQGGSTSSQLRSVDVPVLSNERCNKETNYRGRITDNMMCAGVLEGGKDSCQGDSGGPLIVKNGNRATLVGVVSWGYGCAQKNSPGVYARVSRYPDWILANTQGADWCTG